MADNQESSEGGQGQGAERRKHRKKEPATAPASSTTSASSSQKKPARKCARTMRSPPAPAVPDVPAPKKARGPPKYRPYSTTAGDEWSERYVTQARVDAAAKSEDDTEESQTGDEESESDSMVTDSEDGQGDTEESQTGDEESESDSMVTDSEDGQGDTEESQIHDEEAENDGIGSSSEDGQADTMDIQDDDMQNQADPTSQERISGPIEILLDPPYTMYFYNTRIVVSEPSAEVTSARENNKATYSSQQPNELFQPRSLASPAPGCLNNNNHKASLFAQTSQIPSTSMASFFSDNPSGSPASTPSSASSLPTTSLTPTVPMDHADPSLAGPLVAPHLPNTWITPSLPSRLLTPAAPNYPSAPSLAGTLFAPQLTSTASASKSSPASSLPSITFQFAPSLPNASVAPQLPNTSIGHLHPSNPSSYTPHVSNNSIPPVFPRVPSNAPAPASNHSSKSSLFPGPALGAWRAENSRAYTRTSDEPPQKAPATAGTTFVSLPSENAPVSSAYRALPPPSIINGQLINPGAQNPRVSALIGQSSPSVRNARKAVTLATPTPIPTSAPATAPKPVRGTQAISKVKDERPKRRATGARRTGVRRTAALSTPAPTPSQPNRLPQSGSFTRGLPVASSNLAPPPLQPDCLPQSGPFYMSSNPASQLNRLPQSSSFNGEHNAVRSNPAPPQSQPNRRSQSGLFVIRHPVASSIFSVASSKSVADSASRLSQPNRLPELGLFTKKKGNQAHHNIALALPGANDLPGLPPVARTVIAHRGHPALEPPQSTIYQYDVELFLLRANQMFQAHYRKDQNQVYTNFQNLVNILMKWQSFVEYAHFPLSHSTSNGQDIGRLLATNCVRLNLTYILHDLEAYFHDQKLSVEDRLSKMTPDDIRSYDLEPRSSWLYCQQTEKRFYTKAEEEIARVCDEERKKLEKEGLFEGITREEARAVGNPTGWASRRAPEKL